MLKNEHSLTKISSYLSLDSHKLGWLSGVPITDLGKPVAEVICNLLVAVWLSQGIKNSDNTNEHEQWEHSKELVLELTSEVCCFLRFARRLQLSQ